MAYFKSPKILFGKDMLKRLGLELKGRGDKAVIITSKTMALHAGPLTEAIRNAGFQVKTWDGAEPEPSVQLAVDGCKVLSEYGPQWVVGFGGGSAIDTAKASWVLYARPDLKAEELYKSVNPKTQLNLRDKAFFLSVPTTSGTGSEVTWAIVLTDKKKNKKIAFANNEIVPDIALLVPEFTLGMPKALTACTGMDVLAHALDGYTAQQQTDFSDGLCLQAIQMTFMWLPKAYSDGANLEAREKMQNAAAIAGLGFGNSNTSLCHALAHSLGVVFGIPHGRAVGISLVYSLEYIASNPFYPGAPNPVDRLANAARFIGIEGESSSDAIQQFLDRIDRLRQEIHEPLTMEEAGISKKQLEEHLEELVLLAEKDVNMYSSPCECVGDSLKSLFLRIWSGRKAMQ